MAGVLPVVSIVVPAYDCRAAALRSVASLVNQDFDRPYEVIVVDDGSSDGTADAVEALEPPVRVVRQGHAGAAAARRAGVEASLAPWVAFHDADDFALPHKVRVLHDAVSSHPDCVAAFACCANVENDRRKARYWAGGNLDGRHAVVADPLEWMLGSRGPIASAMNLIARRNELLAVPDLGRTYPAANDYALQAWLASRGPFVFVATTTCVYERQSEGLTGTFGELRQAAWALRAADEVCRVAATTALQRQALRRRVEREVPALAARLAAQGHLRLAAGLLPVFARHARWWKSPVMAARRLLGKASRARAAEPSISVE